MKGSTLHSKSEVVSTTSTTISDEDEERLFLYNAHFFTTYLQNHCKTLPVSSSHLNRMQRAIEDLRRNTSKEDQIEKESALSKQLGEIKNNSELNKVLKQFLQTEVNHSTFMFWVFANNKDVKNLAELVDEHPIDHSTVRESDGNTIVHEACALGSTWLLRLFLDTHYPFNPLNAARQTALHVASARGHSYCVDHLLSTGSYNINAIDLHGNTAAHYAAANNHSDALGLLIKAVNFSESIRNSKGQSVVDLATQICCFKLFHTRKQEESVEEKGGEQQSSNYQRYAINDQMVRGGRSDQVRRFLAINQQQLKQVRKSMMSEEGEADVMSPNEFESIRKLGTGGFGEVTLVRHKKTKRQFAMKTMSKDLILRRQAAAYVLRERAALEAMKDIPFACQMSFAFQDSAFLYLGLEYIKGEDLSKVLFREDTLKEDVVRKYMCELTVTLGELHKKGIAYRDLKPENILVDEEGHLKLVDFGLVKMGLTSRSRGMSFCGTAAYLSPEMVQKKGHNCEVDWYALGVVAFELLAGFNPYEAQDAQKTFANILNKRIVKPGCITLTAWDFIQQLTNRNPAERLGHRGVNEVQAHKWFEGVDWEAVRTKQIKMHRFQWMNNCQSSLGQNSDIDEFPFEKASGLRQNVEPSIQKPQGSMPYFYNWTYY